MRHMLLIPTTGDVSLVVADTLDQMRTLIGADHIERVRVGTDWALAVDADGRLTARYGVNRRASLLYGVEDHGVTILGDVLLGREGMTGTGDDMGIDFLDTHGFEALDFLTQRGVQL